MSTRRFIGLAVVSRLNPFLIAFNATMTILALSGHPMNPADLLSLLPKGL